MVSMLYVTPDLTIAITFKNLNSNLISQLIPSFLVGSCHGHFFHVVK